MKVSRPIPSAIDLIPSMTSAGGPQNQAFCSIPSRNEGTRAGAPGHTPGAPVLVGVAHETERREPLEALAVRGLESEWLPLRCLRGTHRLPDHVLAELLRAAVPSAGRLVGAHDIIEAARR